MFLKFSSRTVYANKRKLITEFYKDYQNERLFLLLAFWSMHMDIEVQWDYLQRWDIFLEFQQEDEANIINFFIFFFSQFLIKLKVPFTLELYLKSGF